jgi:hypothetical protein
MLAMVCLSSPLIIVLGLLFSLFYRLLAPVVDRVSWKLTHTHGTVLRSKCIVLCLLVSGGEMDLGDSPIN